VDLHYARNLTENGTDSETTYDTDADRTLRKFATVNSAANEW